MGHDSPLQIKNSAIFGDHYSLPLPCPFLSIRPRPPTPDHPDVPQNAFALAEVRGKHRGGVERQEGEGRRASDGAHECGLGATDG